MRVQFVPNPADVQIRDTQLYRLIGGEENVDDFLNAYISALVATLQKDVETRNDLLIGDYGASILLEDHYGDYPFAIILQMKKVREVGSMAELVIEKIDFYNLEEGREVAQELTLQHGQDHDDPRVMTDAILDRLREICMALPEATEDEGGVGSPSFKVREKIFAMRHPALDGRPSLWFKAQPGFQDVIVSAEPERFFVPPYVGHHGWVGIWLDMEQDWGFIADLVEDSYRMTAPKRLVKLLPQRQMGSENM